MADEKTTEGEAEKAGVSQFEDPRWAEHGDPAFSDPETGLAPNTHGTEPGPLERSKTESG